VLVEEHVPMIATTFDLRAGCPVTFTGGPGLRDLFVSVPGFDTVPRKEALTLLRAAYGKVTLEEFAAFSAEQDHHVARVEAAARLGQEQSTGRRQ
jgi:hypothetical protein